ncbi:oxidoreductase [Vibrio sp. UCD-FRSSP16_10]|uniref:aldo/keto reductase n=1 Tax=unclassified Vibrio TaxID=2614977 RepID=UPI00080253F4|nr:MULTISPECIES: aldo/keto reductase [unclassified Vibrio]OBT13709.1 oxidoreductase [Vibrio sp. UCD-FRSSP16_30]OBT20034.1 oxidoreductase [Vibrio sp. UCD-FRSSP16_10]
MVNKVSLVKNGPDLSELIQGYWRVAEWGMTASQRLSFMQKHIELGVTTVDHADIYGGYECERLFGEALALDKSLRHQIEIVTKCNIMLCGDKNPQRKVNHYDSSKQHIIASVENSLRNLQVDNIDVLLLHRADALMNADEVSDAFASLKASGKVSHFGVSNFTPRGFELLQSRLDSPLVTNQVEINPLNFAAVDDGTLDLMQTLRTRPMAWSCLAGGAIFHGDNEQVSRVREELEAIKQEIGATSIDQVIYAWVRKLPCLPLPIIGSGNIERVQSAVQALELSLTNEQWYRVWVASKGHGVP